MSAATTSPRVRLKTIAIPPEHGAWGFLLEPLLLGLIVAPSLAGLCLTIAVIGAFLARHPLKIALVDWRHRKRYTRTRMAERVVLAYSLPAALGLSGAVALAGVGFLLPSVLAVPLAVLLFAGYTRNRGRDLLPELAGASALALAASSLTLAGGETMTTALVLWGILTARDIPSILYVRARLRLERNKPLDPAPTVIAHTVGVLVVLALVWVDLAPVLALVAITMLLLRALYGLSPYRHPARPQIIGFQEIGYGLLTVILTAAEYAL